MRLFVGIALSDALRRELARAQRVIAKELGKGMKIVPAEQLHLTVKFLGETDAGRLAEIRAALDDASGAEPAFEMTLSGFGVFPPAGRVSIVWAGLLAPPALSQCVSRCEERFAALGFPAERREYHPHVTLFRVKSRPHPSLRERLAVLEHAAAAERVDRVSLFESKTSAEGAVYKVIHESSLA